MGRVRASDEVRGTEKPPASLVDERVAVLVGGHSVGVRSALLGRTRVAGRVLPDILSGVESIGAGIHLSVRPIRARVGSLPELTYAGDALHAVGTRDPVSTQELSTLWVDRAGCQCGKHAQQDTPRIPENGSQKRHWSPPARRLTGPCVAGLRSRWRRSPTAPAASPTPTVT